MWGICGGGVLAKQLKERVRGRILLKGGGLLKGLGK